MPESSIADEITRLSGCRNDILSAISAKGVSVPVGSVLSSCPSLIASIPTGTGPVQASSVYNTGISATATASATARYTANQIPTSAYDTTYVYGDGFRTVINNNIYVNGVAYDWSSVSGADNVELNIQFYNTMWSPVSAFFYTGDSSRDPQAAWPNNIFWTGTGFTSTSISLPISAIVGTASNYSSQWSPDTKINMSFAGYSDGHNLTANQADGMASIKALTAISYPYPDRPTTEYITASGSVSSYEYVNKVNGVIISSTGSVVSQSNYGTMTQPVSGSGYGYSPGKCTAEVSNKLTAALNSSSLRYYFPATAYDWHTPGSYTVSTGVSGLY